MIDLIKLYSAIRAQLDVGTIEASYGDVGGRPHLTLRWRASAMEKDVGFDEVHGAEELAHGRLTKDDIADRFVARVLGDLKRGGDPPYLGRGRL
jgi:hypothetical protein